MTLCFSRSSCVQPRCVRQWLWLCVWWGDTEQSCCIYSIFPCRLPKFSASSLTARTLTSTEQVEEESVLMNVFQNGSQSERHPLQCEMWSSCDLLSQAGGRGALCVSVYERLCRWCGGAAVHSPVFRWKTLRTCNIKHNTNIIRTYYHNLCTRMVF